MIALPDEPIFDGHLARNGQRISDDLLPWGDPYIAKLVAFHKVESKAENFLQAMKDQANQDRDTVTTQGSPNSR